MYHCLFVCADKGSEGNGEGEESEEQSGEQSGEPTEEEEEEEDGGYYNLRKRQPVLYHFRPVHHVSLSAFHGCFPWWVWSLVQCYRYMVVVLNRS